MKHGAESTAQKARRRKHGAESTAFVMDTPLPVMRGRYCRRSRALNGAMQAADALLTVCRPLSTSPAAIEAPRRLLISNCAHLGDLVVTTALLPVLKSAFPECRIGFLIGSWARPVLDGHPLVDRIHILDHWAVNRATAPRREKLRQYLGTRRQALREVREAGYDTALDLSWNFPNTLPFFWQARIPVRIGYRSGGGGPLATHCLDFDARELHASERHLALVRQLPVTAKDLAKAAPVLAPVSGAQKAAQEQERWAAGSACRNYTVFHVGAGGPLKTWPAAKWRSLAQRWLAAGRDLEAGREVVFTGFGERDAALIAEITADLPGSVNLCGRLDWGGLVALISQAQMLVCVDTVAGHIAGAVGTPCAVITTGQSPYLWHPLGQSYRVLTLPVPCAPCHRGLGCASMECIREVEVEQVYQAAHALLADKLLPDQVLPSAQSENR